MTSKFRLSYIAATAALLLSFAIPLGSDTVENILGRASTQLGTPYRSGGTAPGGFDCSGFVTWLYRPTVPDLPRISRDQARYGTAVASGEWLPGDLLFYATGPDPNRINHVAVWYGDGRIIHSISGGPETGVVITPADASYWDTRYRGSRRVLPVPQAAQPSPVPAITPAPEGYAEPEESPWDDFDGILRGDYESWKTEEEEAFEAWKEQSAP